VNSVSTPVGGIAWTPPVSEREELRKLIDFLENKRTLFVPNNLELPLFVRQSVEDIREELNRVIRTISEDSRAGVPLRIMRAACHQYLTWAQGYGDMLRPGPPRGYGFGDNDENEFFLALGELRGIFGTCLAEIAAMYSLNVHGPLGRILREPGDE
jgi:hypothetical protein